MSIHFSEKKLYPLQDAGSLIRSKFHNFVKHFYSSNRWNTCRPKFPENNLFRPKPILWLEHAQSALYEINSPLNWALSTIKKYQKQKFSTCVLNYLRWNYFNERVNKYLASNSKDWPRRWLTSMHLAGRGQMPCENIHLTHFMWVSRVGLRL